MGLLPAQLSMGWWDQITLIPPAPSAGKVRKKKVVGIIIYY
jgi:hypothetical protein